MTLICFPWAGGSPEVFRSWAGGLADGIELLAVRLPGRGPRIKEPPYENWELLLKDAAAALSPHLERPHALYGHSFGGRLAYELARLAATAHPGRTRRLFVSACRSPDTPQGRPHLHTLSDHELREALLHLGGMPPELLGDDRLMRLMLPTIRSEIRLAETWGGRDGGGVEVPITAMCGRADHVDGRAGMARWSSFGGRGCELVDMPGGHFFPLTHRPHLLDVLNSRLGAPGGQDQL
ncbi:alpha/beta fold hydrolase [Streptomyces sp. NBC_01622]|uniref:thioesterase II family protein n=1 Tax=Streptomyces sp. NBC_01622 TaxID=2975903 RepID=UPI00386BA9F9|nr:alpha/beta fold hydrolase [Streptomyces sp. NBC_01622]